MLIANHPQPVCMYNAQTALVQVYSEWCFLHVFESLLGSQNLLNLSYACMAD